MESVGKEQLNKINSRFLSCQFHSDQAVRIKNRRGFKRIYVGKMLKRKTEAKEKRKHKVHVIPDRYMCRLSSSIHVDSVKHTSRRRSYIMYWSGGRTQRFLAPRYPSTPFWSCEANAQISTSEASNICLHIKLSLSPCAFVFISNGEPALLFIRAAFFLFASSG